MTKRIRFYGIVQGVGFRPTAARHAAASGIRGTVCNKGPYVEVFAEGTEEEIASFLDLMDKAPPKRAVILRTDVREAPEGAYAAFSIIESEKTRGEIFVSPDIAICEDCKRELYDPKDRRYLHPFINCTCCGPRLTILEGLPYDRHRTSMKAFPMCPVCEGEYHSPRSRRYDAQPVCCHDCGPVVYLAEKGEGGEPVRGLTGREALIRTRQVIREGGIAAVKGIGGFHLCCDASNEEAVALLRKRKRRPVKPFAVMMRDEETVRRACRFSPAQEEILTGYQKPILLLEEREGSGLAPSVAPGNPKVGVMLPYAPVQLLLFDYDDGQVMPDMLVMTSGNVSGAPICRDDREALSELSAFTDCILSHDRMIRIRCDDSVMDFYEDAPYMIRRSRGYAPLPVPMSWDWEGSVLAMGGELKNTFCVGSGSLLYPSSYIGDLEDLRSVKALKETAGRMETLLEVRPQAVVCDLHPRYNSTLAAEETGLPVIRLQHHYAHIMSCLAENDCRDRVIGVSLDGTGYGTDGTIWGGEILTADYEGFERAGSIVPFTQTGGDLAAREGWRIAASMAGALYGREKALQVLEDLGISAGKGMPAGPVLIMSEKGMNSVRSTSCGRLFDAVSAILGVRTASTFEGEASTSLQFSAEAYRRAHPEEEVPAFPDPVREGEGRLLLATDDLVRELADRRLAGEEAGRLALFFHSALADMILEACRRIRDREGLSLAALSGGCFQNTLLLELTEKRLAEAGFTVLRHRLVPPNDGGLALGQAAVGMYRINQKDKVR